MKRLLLDNSGRTWFCICCNAVFFIPEVILGEQRNIGCPICSKGRWKNVSYGCLFIKDTSKLGVLTEEKEEDGDSIGIDTIMEEK